MPSWSSSALLEEAELDELDELEELEEVEEEEEVEEVEEPSSLVPPLDGSVPPSTTCSSSPSSSGLAMNTASRDCGRRGGAQRAVSSHAPRLLLAGDPVGVW